MKELESALESIRSGSYHDALRQLESLCNDGALGRQALGHRAWLYLTMGEPQRALQDYRMLQNMDPASQEVKALTALCLFELGDYADAMTAATEVLSREPRQRHAYTVLRKLQSVHGCAPGDYAEAPPPPPQEEPGNRVIFKLEDEGKSFPVSCHPLIGRYLYSLLRLVRPKTVVETGSYIGYSTCWIAQALEDNRYGHLHAFDLFMPLENYTSPILGKCRSCHDATKGHLEAAGLLDRVTLHPGDSPKKIVKTFTGLATEIDFAFIDGDHSCRGACADFSSIDKFLATGGLVLLHDTVPETVPWLGPRYLLDQLDRQQAGSYSVLNLPTPDSMGLGAIQKNAAGVAALVRPSLLYEAAERLRYGRLWFNRR